MTVQELYEIVHREIEQKASLDPVYRSILKKMDTKTANFNDTAQMSAILSDILGEQLARHILELPPNSGRSELCQQLLKDHFNELFQHFEQVQSRLDRQNGVGLATVEPDFPAERVQNVAGSLNDTTVSDETIQRRCRNAVSNVANSMHDSFIQENAKFRNDAGLQVTITRTGGADCCEWCAEVSGTFWGYNRDLREVFRRHDNCTCTITYTSSKTRSRLVGESDGAGGTTHKWVESRKSWQETPDIPDYQPTRFTSEQAKRFEMGQLRKQGFVRDGDGVKWVGNELTNAKNGGRIKLADSSQYEIEIHNDTIEKLEKIVVYENDTINQIVLQQAKELLTEAQQYPLGTEIGKIIPLDLPNSNVKTLVGKNGDHTVNLGLCEVPSITMHNHPSGETFSKGDISRFVSDENARAMYVIGNNGKWYALRKKEDFNWVEFQMKTFKISKDPNFAEKVLKEAENYGFTYYQKS